ncbi:dUTP diphosphatase [Christensenellaceae bacterium NSJ-63]|uniref:Deoxyuridine 5'-triphosphate nucleotidohydrolase n=1 Tax=Guopingia tenuis TaxID=2763656 RepID=A0A926HRU1_9FIRM|nr:dUTP diphosphatase [Guopingia tenuis]MBC8537752.1 dUTP diphosphatase [Guopingia tenuis]MBS5644256.1 dUTP diphosphatase [Clostridiales bacterium]
MKKAQIRIKKLREDAVVPTYGSPYAAGADLYACLEEEQVVSPGQTVMFHTGIAMEIPEGYAGLIFARSGLASKRGLAPANKVGVVDSDYRGEFMIALHNHSDVPQTVLPGERIAQMVITPVLAAEFLQVEELEETQRGSGGFGSTGR